MLAISLPLKQARVSVDCRMNSGANRTVLGSTYYGVRALILWATSLNHEKGKKGKGVGERERKEKSLCGHMLVVLPFSRASHLVCLSRIAAIHCTPGKRNTRDTFHSKLLNAEVMAVLFLFLYIIYS